MPPLALPLLVISLAVAFALPQGVPSASSGYVAHVDLAHGAKLNRSIQHIVILLQENRAFDSIYGTYCPTTGTYCSTSVNGIPPGTCLPKVRLGTACLPTFNFSAAQLSLPADLGHTANFSTRDYDHGKMDGFYYTEKSLNALGHYNATTVPVYYNLAEQYGLSENFFQSAADYSLPNHWYLLASSMPAVAWYELGPQSIAAHHRYLNEANATPTIEDELMNSTISWKYYDTKLQTYQQSIGFGPGGGSAYSFWNPLAARAQSYQAAVASHFAARSSFFTDAAAGTLPQVSWLIPSPSYSDHPPSNITVGQNWVASVVNAIEGSPEWNTTTLFVSWDDWGGFYDHVPPPYVDPQGDGFRVPMLAIGPYVKQGYVSTTTLDFGSLLALVEHRFGLACLGSRDCNATLPLDMFNFSMSPRAPIFFSNYTAGASYPMLLQSSRLLPLFPPTLPDPTGLEDPVAVNVTNAD